MPWSDGSRDGMRLKQEIRLVDPPHSLVLSNNSTRELDEIPSKKTNDKVSPETLSHRLEKGWQHLQECSDPFLNNNNNPVEVNDNAALDDSVAFASDVCPSFADGDYHDTMSSEDSGSSSEDESSASFSDTSPLLDVSSLGHSDASLDSDMSEDSSSSTSSSSSSSSDAGVLDECDNFNNNNEEEEEDVSILDAPSMQSSWMSFSSVASSPSLAGPSRAPIVLPDVLPVGMIPKMPDDVAGLCDNGFSPPYGSVATRNLEITFEKRSKQEHGISRMGGDCCLVEITTQPDVQVDIRVNPVSSRPHRESRPMSIKHGNTYPREARNKRYLKNRDISAWIVNDSFDEHYDDKTNKPWALEEGIRLNNFTIVNGHKTLSLTELVDANTNEEHDLLQKLETERQAMPLESCVMKTNGGHLTNSYQNFERNYSKLPPNVHMCCKDNWRHQKDFKNSALKQKSATETAVTINTNSPLAKPKIDSNVSRTSYQPKSLPKKLTVEKSKITPASRISITDSNSNNIEKAENFPTKPMKEISFASKKKTNEKRSSLDLFEVYTMETALPQINWAAISKGCKESDWIRKRRNDREEIRRKLAMDSDTEDYVSEKLSQHREAGGSYDRLKSTGNLQICFMNEAAKDQELSNPEEDNAVEKNNVATSRIQKPSLHLPSTPPTRAEKVCSVKLPNTTTPPPSVTKRPRPKFFFNRPRSWHASKQSESPEEDLLTRHVRLQAEAREALAQAKEMARMQMEIERQKKKKSPIADIVGLPFPDGKTFLSHHALVAMNVAQLQVIVNDLHSQIETLNEDLVRFLLERDDLHMEQDSKLVDIEDLTRYLGLKGSSVSSSSSQVSVNSTSDSKKVPTTESVRRSQSVHLKSKNLM